MINRSIQIDEFYLDLQDDGQNIVPISEEKMQETPYPGLRPYKTSEYPIFFGRDGQSDKLVQRLKKHHFLAVLGSSGTGKSSLVRAGMLPQLHGGYLYSAGHKWNIAICRPGASPITNLAVALCGLKIGSFQPERVLNELKHMEEMLLESSYGILEIQKLLQTKSKSNLLVIIDQFEELIRFNKETNKLNKVNLSNHFVELLLKAVAREGHNIYVVITMRSEFLGDCVQFKGLSDLINSGQYLVPQHNTTEIEEVITGPMRLIQKKITKVLVNRLVDDLGDGMDQLPLLQHSLMRTFNNWKGKDEEGGAMTISHYQQIGGMEHALANHADELYQQLADNQHSKSSPSKKQQVAKVIFKSLTDRSSDDRGIRRPCQLAEIYGIAKEIKATKDEVNKVIDHFRGINTSFLMPPINVTLRPDLIIDISHESLMRNWELLEKWIDEEVASSKAYKSLNERRELNEWVSGGLLMDMLRWRKENPVNGAWAKRYHREKVQPIEFHEKLFKENVKFLNESQAQSQKAIKEEANRRIAEAERDSKEKRMRLRLASITVATIISIGLAVWAIVERAAATEQRQIAVEASKITQKLADEAQEAQKEAEISADIASDSARAARLQRLKADSSKSAAQKAQADSETARDLAEKRRKQLENQNIEIAQQRDSLETLLVVNRAQEQQIADRTLESESSRLASSAFEALKTDANRAFRLAEQSFTIDSSNTGSHRALQAAFYQGLNRTILFNRGGFNENSIQFAFDHSGQKLATLSGGNALGVWNLTTAEYAPIKYSGANEVSITFSPSGNFLSVYNHQKKEIAMFDLRMEHKEQEVFVESADVLPSYLGQNLYKNILFSPNEQRVALLEVQDRGDEDKIKLIATTGKSKGSAFVLKANFDVSAMAISPDGNSIAAVSQLNEVAEWQDSYSKNDRPTAVFQTDAPLMKGIFPDLLFSTTGQLAIILGSEQKGGTFQTAYLVERDQMQKRSPQSKEYPLDENFQPINTAFQLFLPNSLEPRQSITDPETLLILVNEHKVFGTVPKLTENQLEQYKK